MACKVPPKGWACSRERGHDGPCAASPTTYDAAIEFGSIPEAVLNWSPVEHVLRAEGNEELRKAWEENEREVARLVQAFQRGMVGDLEDVIHSAGELQRYGATMARRWELKSAIDSLMARACTPVFMKTKREP